ncbi:2-oxobutyrate oxidase [Rhizobium sp. AC44/96]|uniref:isopenicillin N synthase family dioxygenase n=1 Tax=unclassified Rhizobium TaxID=2613769 RepID=UPI00080F8166|nr:MULTISPECIES: 2-oxoglutarate and iron-dependent oxygenase domain-containing protein [unclassified Rhizobium]MDM9622994.1 2-oxoglutarate and iron-dependent oxygenase domain-containing protein [Rhizobium sp. S96]OCJ13118.1 2-oxobutyrate oxidase [Rhizobium sp. AC44/96]
MTATPKTLPILDLKRFATDHPERDEALAELRDVTRTLGFFYLTGHGIPQGEIDDLTALARRFFSLPEEKKLEIEMRKSPHFRGYNRAGLEYTRGTQDWREQVDFGPEREKLAIGKRDPAWQRLIGPNQFPSALPELRPSVLKWIDDVTAVGLKVLQAFSEALGQKPDVFAPIYSNGPNQLLKIVRYPGRDQTESDQGVGAHKDGGFVTILLQDVVGGLQVDDGEGGWIDAPPIRGTFVINVGELLELASNGYLKANIHRVVTPAAGGDRLSIPFFLGANLAASIPVLDLPPALAAEVRGVTQDPLNPLFREVGRNVLKSRLRSHPDVAREHHADLLEEQERETTAA